MPLSMPNASMNDLPAQTRDSHVSMRPRRNLSIQMNIIMTAPLSAVLLIALLTASDARAAQTALDALKMLPKGAERNLALIEAREGTPAPERWHILVHDAQSENGLREFVVADGKLVANRTLSQFAETLTTNDIIGADAVRFNSDVLSALAAKYAVSNNVRISSMNYELRKENELPVWRVDCLDARGQKVGALCVAADNGKIVYREGFPNEPTEKASRIALERQPPVATFDPAPADAVSGRTPTTRLPRERSEPQETASTPRQIAKVPSDQMKEPAAAVAAGKNNPKRDSRATNDERIARRSSERAPDVVADPPVGPDVRSDMPPAGKAVAKKKDRQDTARGERGDAPPLEPFVEEPPPRPSVVRRIVRHLLPF
jgi:hypothetical protein